jgi:hypothetical protein
MKRGWETVTMGEREHKRDDAHYQRYKIHWDSNCFRSGVCCYYGAVNK